MFIVQSTLLYSGRVGKDYLNYMDSENDPSRSLPTLASFSVKISALRRNYDVNVSPRASSFIEYKLSSGHAD